MANSFGCSRERVGVLAWHAAAPGGDVRLRARRRVIERRSEGKQGIKKGHGKVLYLCATRRRCAEWRSGGAEVLRQHRGGLVSTGVRGGVAAGVRGTLGLHGPTCGVPVMEPRGSGRPEVYRRRAITVRTELTGVGARARFRRGKGLGPMQGPQGAFLGHGGATAVVVRGYDAVKRLGHGGTEGAARWSGGADVARVGDGGCGVEMGCRGRGAFKG